jgi:hypothetical protein
MDKLVILLGILIICCIVFVISKVRGYGSIYGPGYESFTGIMDQVESAAAAATAAAAAASTNSTASVDMKGDKKNEEEIPIEPFELASDKHELSLKATTKNKALELLTKNIKEAFLSKRLEAFTDKDTDDNTNCTSQGKEYKSKEVSSGCNDPAYIRKDSIPCYACNLK